MHSFALLHNHIFPKIARILPKSAIFFRAHAFFKILPKFAKKSQHFHKNFRFLKKKASPSAMGGGGGGMVVGLGGWFQKEGGTILTFALG